MTRTAKCQCHCEMCQRKTGSSYNLGAWFLAANVSATGAEQIYTRSGDAGWEIRAHFCPTCGTTVYWETKEGMPGQFGLAVGCFTDPDFPAPMLSVYGKRRHRWLPPLAETPCFLETPGSELESA